MFWRHRSGFEPTTFQLMSSCQGITFLTGICNLRSTFQPILVARTLMDLAEVTRTTETAINGFLKFCQHSMAIFKNPLPTSGLFEFDIRSIFGDD